MAESVKYWWHSIDLGHGVITSGAKTPKTLENELSLLQLPDLKNKTVLDIGAYDGFYSFQTEKMGAARVVALDHFVWSMDMPAHIQYWKDCKESGAVPVQAELSPHWNPDELPGKRAYDTAHKALNSKVETVVSDFMTMNTSELGTFDVVLYMGVLYHMENPLSALKRLASVTKGLAVIETHAVIVPGYEHLEICEFYSANQLNGDVSNWWGFNCKALEGMCRAAGFNHVKVIGGYPKAKTYFKSGSQWLRNIVSLKKPCDTMNFRAYVHAWK